MTNRTEIQRFQRAQELLKRLRTLEAEERASLLDVECEGDDALRADVESLLAVEEDEAPDPLAAVTSPGSRLRTYITSQASLPTTPKRVGPHRIIRLIGEGGMGSVYEAEQAEPRRRIAVKVLRHGLASPDARRRFQREAELLGRLRHPGIAVLHEAGIDDTSSRHGLPWFSMELVEGKPINVHVQEGSLSLDEKLELLVQLCDAVAHAHQQGVVHRDLKPDNILVDSEGRVRILDFGIARAADAIGDGNTSLTRTGDVIGTLAYMSPEQALGRPDLVDGRSDLYSIGVIAYQILTGRLPHDLSQLALPAALHEIAEAEAERLGSLDGSLRGDLEAIIGKALEKERDRRYPSVDDLLADLQRYLRHEPVVARPPTWSYRLARFTRRNRGIAAALGLTMLTLIAGVIGTTYMALESQARAKESRHSQYIAQVQAAAAALRESDPEAARRHLSLAPEELRGFEWRHLLSRLDASLLQVELPPKERWDAGLTITLRPGDATTPPTARVLTEDEGIDEIDLIEGSLRRVYEARPGEIPYALSPSGDRVLLIEEGEAFLVELESGDRHAVGQVPIVEKSSVRFSRGGEWIFLKSRTLPGTLVHDGHAGEQAAELQTLDPDHDVFVGPDGLAVVIDFDDEAWIVEVATGRRLRTFPDSHEWRRARFSPDGRRLIVSPAIGPTEAWDVATVERLPWLDRPPTADHAEFFEFSPDGRFLTIVQSDRMQRLLDGRTGTELHRLGRSGFNGPWLMDFSSDGRWLAVSTNNAALDVLRTDAWLRDGVSALPGHLRPPRFLGFVPDSTQLVSVETNELRLWDVAHPADMVLRGHSSYVYDLSLSPDGRRVASAAWDGEVRIWDLATREPLHVLKAIEPLEPYGHVAYRPDGKLLASVHSFEARIWDAETGELLRILPLERPLNPETGEEAAFPMFLHQPVSIAWHPDGTWFATGSGHRRLQAWSVSGPPEALVIEERPWPITAKAIEFSPDGRWLALSTEGPFGPVSIELWSVEEQRRERILEGHDDEVVELAFSPDQRWLASASLDGTVRTWRVSNGKPKLVLPAHPDRAYAVAWSPDGTRLATGANDDDLRLWDANTGEELLRLQGHSDYIHALAWHPGGELLISGSGDHDVRLWETTTVRERLRSRRGATVSK
ncbi:MAG: protein kinase [Acidobacteriota bacterium]